MKFRLTLSLGLLSPTLHAAPGAWTCSAYCGGKSDSGKIFAYNDAVVFGSAETVIDAYKNAEANCFSVLVGRGTGGAGKTLLFSSKANPRPESANSPAYSVALVNDICIKN